jgi:hypothetical protein
MDTTLPSIILTPTLIAMGGAALLSLAFSYIPGLRVKFAGVDPTYKRLVMVGLCALFALAVMGVTCLNLWTTNLTCDQKGWVQAAWFFGAAVIANQTTFSLSTTKPDVEQAVLVSKQKRASKKARG